MQKFLTISLLVICGSVASDMRGFDKTQLNAQMSRLNLRNNLNNSANNKSVVVITGQMAQLRIGDPASSVASEAGQASLFRTSVLKLTVAEQHDVDRVRRDPVFQTRYQGVCRLRANNTISNDHLFDITVLSAINTRAQELSAAQQQPMEQQKVQHAAILAEQASYRGPDVQKRQVALDAASKLAELAPDSAAYHMHMPHGSYAVNVQATVAAALRQ